LIVPSCIASILPEKMAKDIDSSPPFTAPTTLPIKCDKKWPAGLTEPSEDTIYEVENYRR
jgi:hypothetical protein